MPVTRSSVTGFLSRHGIKSSSMSSRYFSAFRFTPRCTLDGSMITIIILNISQACYRQSLPKISPFHHLLTLNACLLSVEDNHGGASYVALRLSVNITFEKSIFMLSSAHFTFLICDFFGGNGC